MNLSHKNKELPVKEDIRVLDALDLYPDFYYNT